GSIAGRVDLGRAEVDLERRNSEQGALRRADLGGKVRESGEVVARQSGGQGELPAGELHAVAAVTGKADDNRFRGFMKGRSFGRLGCHRRGPASALGACYRRNTGQLGLHSASRNQVFLSRNQCAGWNYL